MQPEGQERRREHSREDEFQGLAARSLREGVPVDKLDLRLRNPDGPDGPDAKRVDELRSGAKKELLAMAGYTEESAVANLQPVRTAPDAERSVSVPSENTLTAEDQRDLFTILEVRFTSDTERYEGIEWPQVKSALEAAGEKALYALFELEKNGHEVGVVAMEKGGKKGFRFDSCSRVSPAGIRDVDYFRAAEIVKAWSSDGTVDLDLMERDLFEELRKAGIITETGTWDYLKTENPGTPKKPGLAWCGYDDGIYESFATDHDSGGGFRCSLWIPAA